MDAIMHTFHNFEDDFNLTTAEVMERVNYTPQ